MGTILNYDIIIVINLLVLIYRDWPKTLVTIDSIDGRNLKFLRLELLIIYTKLLKYH